MDGYGRSNPTSAAPPLIMQHIGLPWRVVLTGAESTGKTTLARALARHYETVWAPEYLRSFVEQKGALPEPADSRLVADGHLAQEQALLSRAQHVLFLDTDLISTYLYHGHYFGEHPSWLLYLSLQHAGDLYLLADIDIPWIPDEGQRDGSATRAALHARFRSELATRNLSHLLLSGTHGRRLHHACEAIDELLT